MTPARPPRALLWDVGNVIVRWNPRTLYAKIFKEPAELDRFLSHVGTMDWHAATDRGVTFADNIAAFQKLHPNITVKTVPNVADDKILQGIRGGNGHQQVDDQSRAADAPTPADGRGELVPTGEPGAGRQHRRGRVRPIAARGPCGGDRRGWRARPGCASAAGSRACVPGGGCSAGRCACPCSRSTLPVDGTDQGRPPVC